MDSNTLYVILVSIFAVFAFNLLKYADKRDLEERRYQQKRADEISERNRAAANKPRIYQSNEQSAFGGPARFSGFSGPARSFIVGKRDEE